MIRITTFATALLIAMSASAQPADPVVLVIHGGAGTIRRSDMTAERDASVRASLEQALRAGYAALIAGRPALDGVTEAIQVMEDDPAFNAGRGGVFAADGTVRHDASIMDGRTGMAGASSNTQHVRHPILLAQNVMEDSPHVLLTAEGAEEFALIHNMEMVPNSFFHTASRRRALDAVQARERSETGLAMPAPEEWQMHGTVGAVALDNDGHLAAGTSTGGMTNKRWGRVGDAPIIGAGTFANDATCGVSATGHGEYFIRLAVAHDIHSRMKYAGDSVQDAAAGTIAMLDETEGTGGVIVLDRQGNATMPFNTEGMYRATITRSGKVMTAIYDDE